MRSFCQTVEEESKAYHFFREVLKEWGGDWMWENITQEVKDHDYGWLRDRMVNGTLTWCADGSYKRKTAPDVCGVG